MAVSCVFIALSSHHPGITYRRGGVTEQLERMRKVMGEVGDSTLCHLL